MYTLQFRRMPNQYRNIRGLVHMYKATATRPLCPSSRTRTWKRCGKSTPLTCCGTAVLLCTLRLSWGSCHHVPPVLPFKRRLHMHTTADGGSTHVGTHGHSPQPSQLPKVTSQTLREVYVRFEVFTAVTMKNVVFWDIKSQFLLHKRHIRSPLQSPAG
jgi:hypothetical protein